MLFNYRWLLTHHRFDSIPLSDKHPTNLKFVTFTHYSDDVVADVVFEKADLYNTVGEVLAKHGKTQLRIAETEKYPHVTFFMSGGEKLHSQVKNVS